MTKEKAQQYLTLIQALAEGKTIQVYLPYNNKWVDKDDLAFDAPPDRYRIKPEIIKQEFYYIIHKEDANIPRGYYFYTYNDLSAAEKYLKEIDPKGEKYVIMHANASSVESIWYQKCTIIHENTLRMYNTFMCRHLRI